MREAMCLLRVFLALILSISLGANTWAADLVPLDHTDHTNCNCGPRSHEAVHGPERIPISKIETVSVTPVSVTRITPVRKPFPWKTVLAVGAGVAVGFGAVALYNHLTNDDDDDEAPTYLPPVPPPTRPYYYGYPRRPPAYLYGYNPRPVYIRSSPYYPPRPFMLGPPPATLPPIYPQTISYPLYPQQNYFGTQIPQYYPTYNYSGVPFTI